MGVAVGATTLPALPETNVIDAPSSRLSVRSPFATAYVVAVVIAWANSGPYESPGQAMSVDAPGAIVIDSFRPVV